jgi:hypothetical protein
MIVARQPNPPRTVSIRSLLATSYGSSDARTMVVFGFLLGGLSCGLGVFIPGDWAVKAILLGGGGVVLLMCWGAPALLAWRAHRAATTGLLVSAEVTQLARTGAGDGSTVASMSSGMTRGKRRVPHPSGPFETDYEIDAAWARALRKGGQMLVLVHPTKQKVLFDVGPVEAASGSRLDNHC